MEARAGRGWAPAGIAATRVASVLELNTEPTHPFTAFALIPPACSYNTETVSPEVLAQMKAAMQESASSAASHSFLLDDDSAIPFSHADVDRMVDDKVGGGGGAGGGQPKLCRRWRRHDSPACWCRCRITRFAPFGLILPAFAPDRLPHLFAALLWSACRTCWARHPCPCS